MIESYLLTILIIIKNKINKIKFYMVLALNATT